jgi:two-component system chemotaxis response regulator CheB
MATKTIRVFVVDDSPLQRELLCDAICAAPGLEVAGTACDGQDALDQLDAMQHDPQPDLITLDVQMPRLDGLAALEAILARRSLPVIMVSSLTQRAADVTLQALQLGALDYIAKPEGLQSARGPWAQEIVQKIRHMAGADVRRVLQYRQARQQRTLAAKKFKTDSPAVATPPKFADSCVAIGISTGGPPALLSLFGALEPPLPPIVVVQHMPAQFTGPFARRLDVNSPLAIKEAASGDVLRPSHVYVAPGGRHLSLARRAGEAVVEIRDGDPVSSHKPSVDVMMNAASQIFGQRVLGVIMTGMGHDGVAGCAAIRARGGYVLGQDEATSDVYGMNKLAWQQGHVDAQFALDDAAQIITTECSRKFLRRAETHA